MYFTPLRSPKNVFLKIIAISVLICFVTNDVVFAQPSIAIQSLSKEEQPLSNPFRDLTIPEDIGNVSEVLPSVDGKKGPVIFHIQDAHGSYEAQLNIKRIIEHLVKKYRIPLILLEGAAQPLEPDLFRFFKDSSMNNKIADLLAQD